MPRPLGWIPVLALALLAAPAAPAAGEIEEAGATLGRLVSIPAVPGYETDLRGVIKAALPTWATPEEDTLGNLTVTIGSGAPRRLLVAHMDEPGYVVTAVTDDGYLKVQRLSRSPLPPLFDQYLLGQPVIIGARRGPVPGVVVVYSTHLWRGDEPPIRKALTDEDLFIDIGARSPEEARAAGVGLLDPLAIARRTVELAEGKLAGPAMDDRAGCAALLHLLKIMEPAKVRGTLTVAFSAQERMEARGAARLARRVQPDDLLVIDAPGLTAAAPAAARPRAGGGPVVGAPGRWISQDLYNRIAAEAVQAGVPLQNAPYEDPGDAGPFAGRCRILPLGVPVQYQGTPGEVASVRDLVAVARLLKGLLEGGP